ncbi:MAG: HIT domain-containing protein [candidate division Zixibacteria bacterium]|nr:HIT domain-containing protein [candidate division Zixibacteria bacterium]
MDCMFCKIINKDSPAKIIFENDRVIIFKDYRPQADTHLLICPKKHYPTFLDTPPDELAYLHKVCGKLAEYLKIENGFRMTINNGPQGGQIVFHIHIHFLSWICDIGDKKIELELD